MGVNARGEGKWGVSRENHSLYVRVRGLIKTTEEELSESQVACE